MVTRITCQIVSAAEVNEARFNVADLSVDLEARRVALAGREIHISPTEFQLLESLIRHSGAIVTYRYLINEIWNSQQVWHVAYLKLLVSSLRHKLEPDPAHPRYVITERGVGYRMATD